MNIEAHGLLDDLKALRRSRGISSVGTDTRISGAVRELCQISADDTPLDIQQKLSDQIRSLASELPQDLEVVVLVAMGLHSEAKYPRLNDRISWLSSRMHRDPRTIRRRMDEALAMLTEVAMQRVRPGPTENTGKSEDWYVESFDALLRLDLDPPEAREQRVVVATSRITELVAAVSVPRHPADTSPGHDVQAELEYGGQLVRRDQPSESYFKNVILLARPLQAGEKHAYSLRLRVPPGQPMMPHYAHIPMRRSDRFSLRIRFSADSFPSSIWRMSGVPTATLYDRKPGGDILVPDRFGELVTEFRNLRQGLAYGICWNWGANPAESELASDQ